MQSGEALVQLVDVNRESRSEIIYMNETGIPWSLTISRM